MMKATLPPWSATYQLKTVQKPKHWTKYDGPCCLFWGARVATWEGGVLAYGKVIAVDQTVETRQLLYVVQYDDGDVGNLDTLDAETAAALALASSSATPPLRTLRRQSADAHLRVARAEKRSL